MKEEDEEAVGGIDRKLMLPPARIGRSYQRNRQKLQVSE